jgi:hypothetical protein
MWMLSLIPTEILQLFVHGVVILAAVLFVASFFFGVYKPLIRIAAFVIAIFGVYFEGGYMTEMEWRARVEELQSKVKEAEEKSAEVNTVIEKQYVDRVKVIKETANANIQYVDRVVTKYDNLCTLSNAAIMLHDSASRNEVARSTIGLDEGTTSLKISDVLSTVTDNYSTYYQVREQVLGWQQWYREQKKIFESVK